MISTHHARSIMRLVTLLLIVWAAGSSAAILPSCGSSCVARAIQKTDCTPSDTRCICASEHYSGYLQYCITKKCSTSDRDCKRISAKLLDWPDHSHEKAELKSATAICRVLKEAQTEEGDTNANFVIQKRNPIPNQHDRGYHRGENKPAPAPAPGRGHQPAPPPPPPPLRPHRPSPSSWYTPTPTHTVLP
ncbi:hypothetical protein D6D17_10607 [Aureobasidium pullulans]|uniref:CFEM domain-containing protein n=1 Tax=Aureobasidium pullulans TaxID=5580 RepID=A0A4S8XJP9_AURPU|nr:hypothetical protein D6D22_06545 [Aureobasidium pullulans]THW74331.1 hypothetical protein D6D17_10607 [Aureobasidium pullulans]THY69090.1 hypothetical protein D6C94_09868 [Aureobasidium pullulans]THZ40161.1 hypothetical protein D6C87_06601 [Aureobasidium pullulans]